MLSVVCNLCMVSNNYYARKQLCFQRVLAIAVPSRELCSNFLLKLMHTNYACAMCMVNIIIVLWVLSLDVYQAHQEPQRGPGPPNIFAGPSREKNFAFLFSKWCILLNVAGPRVAYPPTPPSWQAWCVYNKSLNYRLICLDRQHYCWLWCMFL